VAWLLLAVIAVSWWAFLRPAPLGGPLTLITVTGVSMEPTMHTDDLAVIYARGDYVVGDVVAFRAAAVPGQDGSSAHVIHRVVGGDGDRGYAMRGDNNDWDDPWTPTRDEVAGRMILLVPNAGVVMRWISQPVHIAALLAGVATTLVLSGGNRSTTPPAESTKVSAEVAS